MPIIKKTDIYAGGKIFTELQAEIDKLTLSLKNLQKQTRETQQAGTGAEAQKRITLTKELTQVTNKLIKAEDAQAQELADLRLQTQLANKAAKEAATLASSKISLYQKESIRLNNLRKQYKELALQNQQNTKAGKALLANLTKLDQKLKKVDATVGQSQRKVGSYGLALKNVAKQILFAGGIVSAILAVGRVLKDALNIYKDFEKANSRLAAILGKNKDEIKDLTEQAKLLGSTTAFTASQVISLQIELGKLGFSLKEIEASTPGILDLAAATGTDLASAAELAGATLRIFNLDASEMQRVTDVLALSTTKSSLSMEKLATILPVVGKTAQIAGVSLEKTAALAGTLTDRGLDASSAATSLRNIFLELSKKGITWNDAMQQINESTDKNKTSMDLFGKRAAAAGVVLSETAESTEELTEALNDADGAAKRMADTMLDNLSGDITKATSAWEGFILSVESGEGIISSVMRASTQAFTNFLGVLTDLNNGMTLFEIRAKKTSALTEGLEKDTKGWTESLKELTTHEEKENFIATQSIRIKQKLRGANFTLNKLQKEIANNTLNIFSDEFSARGKLEEQTKFNIIAYKEQIKILEELAPVEIANNDIVEEGTEDLKNNNKELEKANKLRKEAAAFAARDTERVETVTSITDAGTVSQNIAGPNPLELNQMVLDSKAAQNDRYREEELQKIQDQADARVAIAEAAETAIVGLASDLFATFQDEKLAEINSKAEAEKKILQQRLDDGLISEEQFAEQVQDIEKKQRIASAKADKKKAIFDIAIATIVASIKALPNLIASAAILVIGGIQAAAVAAKPIPKFAEGGKVGGEPHSRGGTLIEAEANEYVVKAAYAPDSENVLNAVNTGLINDDNFNEIQKPNYDRVLSELLKQGNRTSEDMLQALLNGVSTYDEGNERFILSPRGKVRKFNIK